MRVKFDPIPKHTYVHAPVMSEADTGIEFRVGGASLANVQVEESVRTAIITSIYYIYHATKTVVLFIHSMSGLGSAIQSPHTKPPILQALNHKEFTPSLH